MDNSKMGFGEAAEALMESRRDVLVESTWVAQERRYRQMRGILRTLEKRGRISTTVPADMTPEDVRTFLTYRKRKVGGSNLRHDISALKQICRFCGNSAADRCMVLYPNCGAGFSKGCRLPPLTEDQVRSITEAFGRTDRTDFRKVRAYAMVLLCICSGARNKELRLADADDLDTENWILHIEHVKGEGTYGLARDVYVTPPAHEAAEEYLRMRAEWLSAHRIRTDALFFAMGGDGGHLSSNRFRSMKKLVEEESGVSFELRDCRRTYGQMYIDRGLDISDVSLMLGHKSTSTTETYYCRENSY